MEALSVSRSTLTRMVRKGLLPAPQKIEGIGNRWWEDEILSYLAMQRLKKRQERSENKPA